MEHTRESYDQARRILDASGLGTLSERRWPSDDRRPYPRRAYDGSCLRSEMPASEAPGFAARWVALAIEVGGYLTLNVHATHVLFQILVSVDLTAEEQARDDLAASGDGRGSEGAGLGGDINEPARRPSADSSAEPSR